MMSTAKDYRAMDQEARTKELEGLLREQFNLRMQKATAQLANNAALSKVRRNIARLRTVMGEGTNEGKGK
jgi:large subunit ribosomal protein L29